MAAERLSKNESLKKADEVLGILNKMGWNLYARDKGADPNFTIEHNLADALSLEQGYVLMPKADNPTDSNQVWAALEELAIRLHREWPSIIIKGQETQMSGITPHLGEVHIHCPKGLYVSYDELIAALPSFLDISQT